MQLHLDTILYKNIHAYAKSLHELFYIVQLLKMKEKNYVHNIYLIILHIKVLHSHG